VKRALLLVLSALLLSGCPSGGESSKQVVVYCALDRLYAQPVLEAFEARTGIEVLPKWDTESTKTTGLVQAIRAEKERGRCDVFWNNEVGQTIGLARDGLLEPYASPVARELPEGARDSEGRWTGFAARARVLIVNTDLVAEADTPRGADAFLDPRWKGRCGIAKPLFGTTATHVAALFAARGPEQAKAWLAGIKANGVVVCAGNADVKDRVAAGELAFGLTDTDDASLALLEQKPVRVVFPDQEPGGLGTLMIPNSVAIVKGAPHSAEARALVDYLLSAEVEEALAASRSVQVPLRPGLKRAEWIPPEVRTFAVSWSATADAFEPSRAYVRDVFLAE